MGIASNGFRRNCDRNEEENNFSVIVQILGIYEEKFSESFSEYEISLFMPYRRSMWTMTIEVANTVTHYP